MINRATGRGAGSAFKPGRPNRRIGERFLKSLPDSPGTGLGNQLKDLND